MEGGRGQGQGQGRRMGKGRDRGRGHGGCILDELAKDGIIAVGREGKGLVRAFHAAPRSRGTDTLCVVGGWG